MKRYDILCTAYQTSIAVRLGAPIEHTDTPITGRTTTFLHDGKYMIFPTAEQMTRWLEKEYKIRVSVMDGGDYYYAFCNVPVGGDKVIDVADSTHYKIHASAWIAAIESALKYIKSTSKIV